jgi:hypothetical protein
MMRALLIRHPFIDMILDGKKTWEMRGSRTIVRETVALVPSGSGTVVGVCNLVDCVGPLTAVEYRKNARKAGTLPSEAKLGYYKKTYAWVVARPRYLNKPVLYRHPTGAIIWVTLHPRVERAIRRQL